MYHISDNLKHELWLMIPAEAPHTPHGRGHITGYVKHFCSFYVDITGYNP